MSEFYFDYKCIAMGEQDPTKPADKALDFYLFQDYRRTYSNMCVQIYIPQEMQKKYVSANVYYSVNDISIPDILSGDFEPIAWQCKPQPGQSASDGNFISKDNCIFIESQEDELSGCGVLAFLEKGDDPNSPRMNNCYKFIVNYKRKEAISYRILETKDAITVQVLYPLIRNELTLHVIEKEGAKPVFISDRSRKVNRLGYRDKPLEIKLKPHGRRQAAYKAVFRVRDASRFDYRLTFADPTNSKYYLLADESDFTMEDKETRRKERLEKNRISIQNPRCPYCGGELKAIEKYRRGTTQIWGCDGKLLHDGEGGVDPRLKGELTVVCSADLKKMSEAGSDGSAIPVNKLILPKDYEKYPAMNIVLAGFPKSGKTIYLSSIFNMQYGGPALGTQSYPTVLNSVLHAYDPSSRGRETAEEVKFYNVHLDPSDKAHEYGSITDDCERLRTSPMSEYKKRYAMNVGGEVEAQTASDDMKKLSWHPIGYRLGKLGHIYFYDIPGEVFSASEGPVRALDMADCFLAVIDGANEEDKPVEQLVATLERIPILSKKKIDMESIPIAIVFTKHDLKLSDYVNAEKTELAQQSLPYCFDENCHVVRENILEMFPKDGGVYEGSALERHIDCSSYEFEHYLKAKNADLFRKVKSKYKNIKFFTCSALGSDQCLGDSTDDKKKQVLFRPRHLRVELPIIWLMYKMGLIRR